MLIRPSTLFQEREFWKSIWKLQVRGSGMSQRWNLRRDKFPHDLNRVIRSQRKYTFGGGHLL